MAQGTGWIMDYGGEGARCQANTNVVVNITK